MPDMDESQQFLIELLIKELKFLRRTVEQQKEVIGIQRGVLNERSAQIKRLTNDLALSRLREKLAGEPDEED